jgi:transketolase
LEQAKSKKYKSAEEILAAIPEYDPSMSLRNYSLLSLISLNDAEKNVATRQSGSDVLQHVAKAVPQYVSGSADLHGSNKNYINGGGNFGNPKTKGTVCSFSFLSWQIMRLLTYLMIYSRKGI